LESVSATFGKPGFTAIVGASGSGKSTLVRLIAGQLDGGEEAIYWGNRAYSTYKSNR